MMTFKEIQELIKLVNKSNLTEFKLKEGEFELSLRTDKFEKGKNKQQVISQQAPMLPVQPIQQTYTPPPAPAPAAPAPAPAPATSSPEKGQEEASTNYQEIKSPIVGTFYRSASPEKPPYVKVGDRIEVGTVLCVVEAMKLFNEIESEVSGTIVKVVVEDAQPVEYDQVLFLIDPNG